jgi:hypothetical protein
MSQGLHYLCAYKRVGRETRQYTEASHLSGGELLIEFC